MRMRFICVSVIALSFFAKVTWPRLRHEEKAELMFARRVTNSFHKIWTHLEHGASLCDHQKQAAWRKCFTEREHFFGIWLWKENSKTLAMESKDQSVVSMLYAVSCALRVGSLPYKTPYERRWNQWNSKRNSSCFIRCLRKSLFSWLQRR